MGDALFILALGVALSLWIVSMNLEEIILAWKGRKKEEENEDD